jgi:hypothetical protein
MMEPIPYKGYVIAEAKPQGGKAGKGHNRTSTIQVREPLQGDNFLLLKQIRYTTVSKESKEGAILTAKQYIDTVPE